MITDFFINIGFWSIANLMQSSLFADLANQIGTALANAATALDYLTGLLYAWDFIFPINTIISASVAVVVWETLVFIQYFGRMIWGAIPVLGKRV